jgi:hypothetical protein
MKGILLILLLFFAPLLILAQSKKVKVYAYQQEVLPGTRQITIDESGRTHEIPNRIPSRTFIYVEAPRSLKMEAKHMWINGKLYGVRTSTPQLPVVIPNTSIPSNPPDTLVRKTDNLVLQLEPVSDVAAFIPSSTARKKMKTNKIVLHTIENGRNCYYYQNNIKILDPVALQ